MEFSLKNFNPTYNEANLLINDYEKRLSLLRRIIYKQGTAENIAEYMKDYNETLSIIKLLEYSIQYSKMHTKLRKFDNLTYATIEAQYSIAEAEYDCLEAKYYALDEKTPQEDIDVIASKLEKKMAEVRELKAKVTYISANYKVKVSD